MTRSVLVVEDEPQVAELYRSYLVDDYEVAIAETGEEALSVVGPETDAVLLDRRLPDRPGADVLAEIRDRGLDCRVAMVTAVEPDTDIVEMGFDLYLVKPATRDDIRDVVSRLETRAEYDDTLQELASLVTKRSLLETERTAAELDGSAEYHELLDRIRSLQSELDDLSTAFSPDDYRLLFREIGEDAEPDGD
ncbi:HalX domain-containing protein [Halobaculum sp. MBLA0147]|uniref:HalX domain-containing protein n=1 Tax=Halobaculum sp. MBLA0147 TaxID=3079934 RepID=UPI003525B2EF